MKRVTCPECGHTHNVDTNSGVEQYAARFVALNISAAIAGATLPLVAHELFGVDVSPAIGAATMVGLANLYAVFDVRDSINALHHKKRQPVVIAPRTASLFTQAVQAMVHRDTPAAHSGEARHIIVERQVFGCITDADVYRFIERSIRYGVARRHHLKHISRDDYDTMVAWLVSIGIIIGRTGNQAGRIITPTAGRAMLVVYKNI